MHEKKIVTEIEVIQLRKKILNILFQNFVKNGYIFQIFLEI